MRMIQSQGINHYHGFGAGSHRIQSCPKMCCEAAQINFLGLKSQGLLRYCGIFDGGEIYRLIPLLIPFFSTGQ